MYFFPLNHPFPLQEKRKLFHIMVEGIPPRNPAGARNGQRDINIPSAIAQAMEFERGEIVEWAIEGKVPVEISPKKRASWEALFVTLWKCHTLIVVVWP